MKLNAKFADLLVEGLIGAAFTCACACFVNMCIYMYVCECARARTTLLRFCQTLAGY
jgi:hypothetical protein